MKAFRFLRNNQQTQSAKTYFVFIRGRLYCMICHTSKQSLLRSAFRYTLHFFTWLRCSFCTFYNVLEKLVLESNSFHQTTFCGNSPSPSGLLWGSSSAWSKQRVTCLQNSGWDVFCWPCRQYILHTATTVALRKFTNRVKFHFSTYRWRYDYSKRSIRSTPPIPLLYEPMKCCCVISLSLHFILGLTFLIDPWVSQLLAIFTIELSSHFVLYTFSSLQ